MNLANKKISFFFWESMQSNAMHGMHAIQGNAWPSSLQGSKVRSSYPGTSGKSSKGGWHNSISSSAMKPGKIKETRKKYNSISREVLLHYLIARVVNAWRFSLSEILINAPETADNQNTFQVTRVWAEPYLSSPMLENLAHDCRKQHILSVMTSS